ncbi:hypothetical protein RYZ26_07065 [Terasakiella sp. A23]|uniref:hypothetical protein n=1 Tax=Terasakiella sp. FCG-A23 TaxID=3080561 RepID=UPI002953A365|nr:hypothetical protein [Terasakiella sp. A23]MDV7339346.1 hypothetical protein [Terasakiella sp. A23]
MNKLLAAIALFSCVSFSAEAGKVMVENNSTQEIKVSSIGGKGFVAAKSKKTFDFKNDEGGADINIWWVKNARQLCQIYTPWDRTISVSGKYTIQCMSRK